MLDLNGDGQVETTNVQNGKLIDIDGNGRANWSAWAGKGDGVLAFGKGANGKHLLGDASDIDGDGDADGYVNGFEALKALAVKHLGAQSIADGKLDQQELAQLENRADLHI